jgi:hypothetical protein
MEPTKSEKGQANTEDLTLEELTKKVETDVNYANAVLEGRVSDAPEETPPAPAPAAVTPAPASAAPEKKDIPPAPATPALAPTADEFVVEMPDGSKIKYKTANEAKKALKEKELFIRKQKEIIADLQAKEAANAAKLVELGKPASPAVPAPAPTVAKAAEEKLDVYSEDYLKNLMTKVTAQESAIAELRASRENDRKEFSKRDEEREARVREDAAVRQRFFEANQFMYAHPEFKMEEPVESVDEKYRSFLRDLGIIASTDGTPAANANAAQLYFDADNNAEGKAIKEKAEAHGVRPPAGTEKYLALARVINESRRLKRFDPDMQKEVPFTLDQTYRYLQAIEDGLLPKAPVVETPPPLAAPVKQPDAPMAAAFKAAEALKGTVATDIPPEISGAAIDIATIADAQKLEIAGWEAKDVRNNPTKRKLVIDFYQSLGQKPPKWATEEAKLNVSKPLLFKGQ